MQRYLSSFPPQELVKSWCVLLSIRIGDANINYTISMYIHNCFVNSLNIHFIDNLNKKKLQNYWLD